MRRISITVIAALLFLVIGGNALSAKQEYDALYRYRNNDGVYGYDENIPVNYYNGSTEQIMIPTEYNQEKIQFKSSWVATIFNIHFPKLNTEAAVKAEYQKKLDTFKEWNMNAMIFQVRPLLDAAYYTSEINPTSEYFTGKQGLDAGFDPMPWMIEQTHNEGMEFHAWFNPYRVTNNAYHTLAGIDEADAKDMTPQEMVVSLNQTGYLADTNYAVLNPDLVLEHKGKLFLNPGEPEVIQHVVDSIAEYIAKYDTDAVHFDDYFYPYKVDEVLFGDLGEDAHTFAKYGTGYTDIAEWRRDNVTALIDGVKGAIDKHNLENKKSVQFGISPFGIWEHAANDPRGSNTPAGSSQSYSKTIFADTYQWIKDEKLDYVAPQIYWAFAAPAAPYGELLRWWNDVAEGTNVDVYVGHANYKHEGNGGWDADWANPEEIDNQMKFNQMYPNITGSALYSSNELIKRNDTSKPNMIARDESIDILKADTFSLNSLTPPRPKLSHGDTKALESVVRKGDTITWTDELNDNARFYVIYAGEQEGAVDLSSLAANIVERVNFTGQKTYTFEIPEELKDKEFAISVLDRAYVETQAVKAYIPLEVQIGLDEVVVEFDSALDELDFIELLNITSNYDKKITTNYSEVVKQDEAGVYLVSVIVAATDEDGNVIEALGTETFEVKVTVKDKVVDPTPVDPDKETDDKPTVDDKPIVEDTPNVEDSNNKPSDKEVLPSTGMSNDRTFIPFVLLGMGLVVTMINKKRKFNVN